MRAHLRAVAASVLGEEPHLPNEGSGSSSSSSSSSGGASKGQRLGSSRDGVGEAGGEAPPTIGVGKGVVALGSSKVRANDVARSARKGPLHSRAHARAHASALASGERNFARHWWAGKRLAC